MRQTGTPLPWMPDSGCQSASSAAGSAHVSLLFETVILRDIQAMWTEPLLCCWDIVFAEETQDKAQLPFGLSQEARVLCVPAPVSANEREE